MTLLAIDPGNEQSAYVEFTVPALPVAQPRQRHRIVSAGGRTFASNYTPAKDPVNGFKATVRMAAAEVLQGPPLAGPLRVDMVFVFPRQKSKVWKSKPMPRYPHISKPDRDNLCKSAQDALNGLAWVDDAQICAGEIQKWHAAGDEQPHVRIIIRSCCTESQNMIKYRDAGVEAPASLNTPCCKEQKHV